MNGKWDADEECWNPDRDRSMIGLVSDGLGSLPTREQVPVKITVTEFPNDNDGIEKTWEKLARYTVERLSDVVVLPELLAATDFWSSPDFDATIWRDAVRLHETMTKHLERLNASVVLGTRPVERDGRRLNQTFAWSRGQGLIAGRAKAWLPEEEGGWEATWFDRGEPPSPANMINIEGVSAAFLVCTELLVSPAARTLGQAGVQLIAVPRATGGHDRWMVGTRMAAISAGAFVATANRRDAKSEVFAGGSWVIGPDGDVLGATEPNEPFATIDIDLAVSDRAKHSYPRYVPD